MHERYIIPEIEYIWSDNNKLLLWQDTELAVINASEEKKIFPVGVYSKIAEILGNKEINLVWWKAKDKELHHDLNAFVAERLRYLPVELQQYFHKKMTSYDTEEPAFARILHNSYQVVEKELLYLIRIIKEMALKYRYTIMNARTHGQEAELQTFGKRCLTWVQDLDVDLELLYQAAEKLKYSKLSGAIGNYGSLDPIVEIMALDKLGLKPFYGSTQIIPRELYAPLAQVLAQIVSTLNKIALAIRLGARSYNPIFQEPFKKTQTGSSAMPHKKNTIRTEQIEGMERMARGYLQMIMENIKTWEERAIEQSCVERVAWPDLFHVTIHSLRVMQGVLKGLQVYPKNMLKEVINTRGCYASSEAKEVLAEFGSEYGLSKEDCYRIVQLAAFNVFAKDNDSAVELATSLEYCDNLLLDDNSDLFEYPALSIQKLISMGALFVSDKLEISEEQVSRWNRILFYIFCDEKNVKRWQEIFRPSYLLRNEAKLYEEILDIKN